MGHHNTMIFLAAAVLSWVGSSLTAADERYVLQYDAPAKVNGLAENEVSPLLRKRNR